MSFPSQSFDPPEARAHAVPTAVDLVLHSGPLQMPMSILYPGARRRRRRTDAASRALWPALRRTLPGRRGQ